MVLNEGDTAEGFDLSAHDGTIIHLDSFKNEKNVVLCFYPKNQLRFCPSKKVFDMAKSVISVYPQIESADAVVFAISVDDVQSQSKFVSEYSVPYAHLSDTEKKVCKVYAGLNMVGLAKRSTFVIDKQGVIRKVFRDIDVKSHGSQIVDSLNEIKV